MLNVPNLLRARMYERGVKSALGWSTFGVWTLRLGEDCGGIYCSIRGEPFQEKPENCDEVGEPSSFN